MFEGILAVCQDVEVVDFGVREKFELDRKLLKSSKSCGSASERALSQVKISVNLNPNHVPGDLPCYGYLHERKFNKNKSIIQNVCDIFHRVKWLWPARDRS